MNDLLEGAVTAHGGWDRWNLVKSSPRCAKPWTGEGDPPNGYYLPRILDPDRARRLWDLSAELTGA